MWDQAGELTDEILCKALLECGFSHYLTLIITRLCDSATNI